MKNAHKRLLYLGTVVLVCLAVIGEYYIQARLSVNPDAGIARIDIFLFYPTVLLLVLLSLVTRYKDRKKG